MLAALAPVILLAACNGGETSAPPPPAPEVAVITLEAKRVRLTGELPGRTEACLVAEVRPQVSGLIEKRLFKEGSDVEEGQVLYQLDDAVFQAAMNKAVANLGAAQKAAEQARAALEATSATVEQERSILKLARTNSGRFENLAGDGAVAISERDRFVNEAEVAAARLRAALARLNTDRQAIEVADAGVAQARAAVESARIDLDYTKIEAPISGRIGKSAVTVGSLVTAHQPLALATIQQLDPIYVDVPQSYGELLRLRRLLESNRLESDETVMNRVFLILEDGSLYAHEGTIQFRDVTVDSATGSVLIRMIFSNPDAVLLPGMFVRAVITEGIEPDGILVPQQAISRNTKGEAIALVLDESDKVEERTVSLDRAIGNEWLVAEGLAAGDRVIMEGRQKVRDGSEVRPVPLHGYETESEPVREAIANEDRPESDESSPE